MTSLSPAHPHQPAPTRFVARDTADLVVLPPLVLGFHPEQSVVMLTFGSRGRGSGPHARVDLGRTAAEQQAVVECLVTAARANDVGVAAVLVYTDDADAALAQARSLVDALVTAGVDVIDAVRVHDDRWFALACGDPSGDRAEGSAEGSAEEPDTVGTAYDVRAHRFTAEHVVSGRVVRADRAELEATLRPGDPTACAALAREVRRRAATLGTGRATLRREALWVRARLQEVAAAPGERLDDRDAARMIVGCRHPDVRDAAWGMLDRSEAVVLVEVLSDVVRRCPEDGPEECVAPVASVLALCAWLAGEGALAWCAVERCQRAQPGHTLAQLVSDLLSRAVPPARWVPATDDELPLLARGCLR